MIGYLIAGIIVGYIWFFQSEVEKRENLWYEQNKKDKK